MKVKWHRSLQNSHGEYEYVLFVGEWEWRINDVSFAHRLAQHIMPYARYRVVGRGVTGGTASDTTLKTTLRQAKACCEDAALRVVEKCAGDLGMRLVPKRTKKAKD